MKIQLTGIRTLAHSSDPPVYLTSPDDLVTLSVTHCGICKSDAKMWAQGHRDLCLPRVPGHEIVGQKDNKRYVVWPGIICGNCQYCRSENENRCDSIKILGFHVDGGFCDTVSVPWANCIPVPEHVDSTIAVFSEPAGCIVNAFRKMRLQPGERLLIYGAGTIGLLTALLSKLYLAEPVIIEKNESKIHKAEYISGKYGIRIIKGTTESHFDAIFSACSDPTALLSSLPKAAKGARIAFFSGLEKNIQLESNLLNLVHYKELSLIGTYGLTRNDMKTGLELIAKIPEAVSMLIENFVAVSDLNSIFPQILEGQKYKYILSFKEQKQMNNETNQIPTMENSKDISTSQSTTFFDIAAPSDTLRALAQQKIDNKTKPLGSLGTLEYLAVKMCCIQNTLSPEIDRKVMFVFAADHGIAEEGVSAFPQEVTRQMVQNFLNGGAAINVLSRHGGFDLSVVDIGVKGPIIDHPNLITKRIADGTRNFAVEPAMSLAQVEAALNAGAEIFNEHYSRGKIGILGLGEMGIANTSAATAIISTITGVPVAQCTGRGTGVDDQGLKHKIDVLEKVLSFHKPDPKNALDILSKIGGFEIAGIAGAALAAASKRCAVVLDGLICTAAGLIAYTINPQIADYFIAGHKSVEIGHISALRYMSLTPVLDLGMRLGEGTGAALTVNLIEAACHIVNEMASFEDAGVSGKM